MVAHLGGQRDKRRYLAENQTQRRHQTLRVFGTAILALLAQLAPTTSYWAHAQSTAIVGVVFADVNASGTRDADERGVAGVTVNAFVATQSYSAVTDANGNYSISLPSSASQARARVEFTNLPPAYQSSLYGPDSRTTVQFVRVPANNVNLGIFKPSDYCQNNPLVVAACFIFGDNLNGLDKNEPTVKSFGYNAQGTDAALLAPEALARRTGSVYGMAYQRTTGILFVGAYIKRSASLGPGTGQASSDGTGTIYRVPINGGPADAVPFLDLDVLMGEDVTGPNPHTDLNPDRPDFDAGAFDAVGKMALGDLELSDDDSTLWAVNMYLGELYRLPIGYAPTPPARAQVKRYPIPAPNCVKGVGRAFALKPYTGLIYVGGVCTAENGGSAADLQAYVFAFNPDTERWSSNPVLQFPLNYNRSCVDVHDSYPLDCRSGTKGTHADWLPWRADVDKTFAPGFSHGFVSYPEPMLSGLEFHNGDIVLGIRDRFADQIGFLDPGPTASFYRDPFHPEDPNIYDLKVVPGGDVLRASPIDSNRWQIENNGGGATFGPSAGANNNQGPGGGEFYVGDVSIVKDKLVHDESALGALAQLPGRNEIIASVVDPYQLFTGGVAWMSHATGQRHRGLQMYPPDKERSYRKANGVGDVEVLCDAAPIQVGNRVWFDTNANGVQEPDEPPIDNVVVSLSDVLGNVTTATTNANGEYYFAVKPGQAYTLAVALEQQVLVDWIPTLANGDATTNGDARDSDGVRVGQSVVIPIAVGGPGATHHTYDFGFIEKQKQPQVTHPAIALQKWVNGNDANVPTGPVVSAGSPVTWTYHISNTGDVTLTNIIVRDDKEGLICDNITLGPGQSTTCTKSGIAIVGAYVNTAVVTGTNLLVPTQTVTTSDVAHYFGAQPGIRIKKFTNGFDADTAPGPVVVVGERVVWTFEVVNTGNITLTQIKVTDDMLGPIACPRDTLAPGEGMICSATGTATLGQYRNVGTVTAVNVFNVGQTVTSVDASHYLGADKPPAALGDYVWLDVNRDGQQTVGEPGIAGITVTLYNNAGQAILTTTTNSQGLYLFSNLVPGTYVVKFTLPPGTIFTAQGSDIFSHLDSNANVLTGFSQAVTLAAGQQNLTIDAGVIKTNPSIDIKKYVNGHDADTPTGPIILAGAPVTWTYIITNTGDVTLTRVTLGDDVIGQVTCPLTVLAPGQSMLCTATGTAIPGNYANVGTVSGYDQLIAEPILSNCVWPSDCNVTPVTDSDPAHYFGAGPALLIHKLASTPLDVNVRGGDLLTYTLVVTNTGNFTATNVVIRDPIPVGTDYVPGSAQPPVISGPSPLVWNVGTLGVGRSVSVRFAVRIRTVVTETAIVNRAFVQATNLVVVSSNTVVNVFAQKAVALAGFSAVRETGGVRVAWRTGAELNTFGFVVHRSADTDADADRATAVQLNAEVIAGKGPGNYQFVDETALPDKAYVYWLDEIELDGKINHYGPIQLNASADPDTTATTPLQTAQNANGSAPVTTPAAAPSAALPEPIAPATETMAPGLWAEVQQTAAAEAPSVARAQTQQMVAESVIAQQQQAAASASASASASTSVSADAAREADAAQASQVALAVAQLPRADVAQGAPAAEPVALVKPQLQTEADAETHPAPAAQTIAVYAVVATPKQPAMQLVVAPSPSSSTATPTARALIHALGLTVAFGVAGLLIVAVAVIGFAVHRRR